MKHIKAYEYVSFDYCNIGDYIIGNWTYNTLSKIIGISNIDRSDRYKQYKVKSLIDSRRVIAQTIESDGTFQYCDIDDDQIARKATPEEIELFDMTEKNYKYNL